MADSLSSIDSRLRSAADPYSHGEAGGHSRHDHWRRGDRNDNSPCNWPPWVSGNSN